MRQRTIDIIAVGLIVIFSGVFGAMTHKVPAPPAIRVQAPTPEMLKAQFDKEFAAKQLAKKLATYERQARVVFATNHCHGGNGYAPLVAEAALRENISARLLAGLIFVESSCNPAASDHLGSHGLTQVNVKTWKQYTVKQLEKPEINIPAGARVLAQYVHKFGTSEGLHHYNGLGNPTTEYADKVMAAAGLA